MADSYTGVSGPESSRSLTDNEILTERKLPRRSFLSATGALLTGATGVVFGTTASELHTPQQSDPDKRPADPDKRHEDPKKERMIRIGNLKTGEKRKMTIARGATIQTRGPQTLIGGQPIRTNLPIHIDS